MNMLELLNPVEDVTSKPYPQGLVVETQVDDTSAARSLMLLGAKDEVIPSHGPQVSPYPIHPVSAARSPVLLPGYPVSFHMSPMATKVTSPAMVWTSLPQPSYNVDPTMDASVASSPPPPLVPLRRRLSSISSMLNELELPSAGEVSNSPPHTPLRPDYCSVTGCLRRPSQQNQGKCAVHKGMKLCQIDGCFRPVQSRGCCKSHGGGARCKYPDCTKGAISKGRCRTHGGGTRCAVPDCLKWAQRFGCCVRHSKAVTPKP